MDTEKVNDCIDTLLFNKGELKSQEAKDIIDVLHEAVKSEESKKEIVPEKVSIEEVDHAITRIIHLKGDSVLAGEMCRIIDMIDECVDTHKRGWSHYNYHKSVEELKTSNITFDDRKEIMSTMKCPFYELPDIHEYEIQIRNLRNKQYSNYQSHKEKQKVESEINKLSVLCEIIGFRSTSAKSRSSLLKKNEHLEKELKQTKQKLEYALKRNMFLSKWT